MKTVIYFLLVCLIFNFSGCKENGVKNGECNVGSFSGVSNFHKSLDIQFKEFDASLNYNSDVIYYYYGLSGKVQFHLGKTIDNICPDKHVNLNFSVNMSTQDNFGEFEILGKAYWSIYNEKFELKTVSINENEVILEAASQVGLKQAFKDEKGIMDVFLVVQFDTKGSFKQDSTFFVNHVSLLKITYSGDKYFTE